MAISSVGNGAWSVQKPDASRANEMARRADDDTALRVDRGREGERPGEDERTTLSQGSLNLEARLGEELNSQLDQSRFSRFEIEKRSPTQQQVYTGLDRREELNTENEQTDSVRNEAFANQQEFDRAAQQQAASAANVEQLLQALNAQPTESGSAVDALTPGVDQIAAQQASAALPGQDDLAIADALPAPTSTLPAPAQSAAETAAPADGDRNGNVSLQELATFQSRQSEAALVEQNARQASDAVARVNVQLSQTYGRFDAEVANATVRANTFSTTA